MTSPMQNICAKYICCIGENAQKAHCTYIHSIYIHIYIYIRIKMHAHFVGIISYGSEDL